MKTGLRVPIASVDIRPDDVHAVARVLESGHLRQGAVTAEFEEAFARRVGARHAVAVSSGTAALHLSYVALFQPGDRVIVPAFTFVATASMLRAVGAEPVFADVDERTFTLSVEDVRSKIDERTKGIVGVHLFGNSCDIEALHRVAGQNGLTLVWDAAQALGTEYGGRDVGSQPTVACYSFYPTKNITTGEGGMIVTNDPDLADRLRLLRGHGATDKYVHVTLGFNFRMTDFQAALGLHQLSRLEEYLHRRRQNAAYLSEALRALPGLRVPIEQEGARHSFNQYCVLLGWDGTGPERGAFASAVGNEGVETAVHYPRPLHRQPVFGARNEHHGTAERLSDHILALPVHPGLTAEDLDHVVEASRRAMKE